MTSYSRECRRLKPGVRLNSTGRSTRQLFASFMVYGILASFSLRLTYFLGAYRYSADQDVQKMKSTLLSPGSSSKFSLDLLTPKILFQVS